MCRVGIICGLSFECEWTNATSGVTLARFASLHRVLTGQRFPSVGYGFIRITLQLRPSRESRSFSSELPPIHKGLPASNFVAHKFISLCFLLVQLYYAFNSHEKEKYTLRKYIYIYILCIINKLK